MAEHKQTHFKVGSSSQRIEVRCIRVNYVIKESCEPGSSVCVHVRALVILGGVPQAHPLVVLERATRALD